jgi:hypothetical protein
MHRRVDSLAEQRSMSIPMIHIEPPINVSGSGARDTRPAYDGEFDYLSGPELSQKWTSLLRRYATAGNEFRALERQRLLAGQEIARLRVEVEALEATAREDAERKQRKP